jgi:HEAT repeat protein
MPSPSRLVLRALFGAACAVALAATPPAARADDAVAMIVDLATRDDAEFRAIGLDGIRHAAKGEAATRAFAALLDAQPADRQVTLIRALADRGDPAALPVIIGLLDHSPDSTVRTTAIAALGVLGSGSEVPLLLESLKAGDPYRTAARHALAIVRGDDAVQGLRAAVTSGDATSRPVLIDLLGERRIRSALPDFAGLATDADAAVRQAAMRALGAMGGAAQVPALVAGVLAAAPGAERQAAERSLVAVCTRNPGHAESARQFLALFQAAPQTDQETLLTALGAIGGAGALAIVDEMVANPAAARRRFGLEALVRWPDASVASRLLDLVGKARDPAERALLVGALIRIAPLPDNTLDDAGKLALVKQTMDLCTTDAERGRLLERASAIRTIETFRFVVPYLDQPALAASARKSVVALAHHRKLRDAHKAEFMAALDTVIATAQDPELVERATRYKEGKTWERKR